MSKLRASTQARRGVRSGYPEHDDFEGLPVRQWRQEWVTVAPAPPADTNQQNDRWAVELPFGLPKEYPLLAPHSQELLRAARSGRLHKRPASNDDEDGDVEEIKGERGNPETTEGGYQVKVWKTSSRSVDDISHLAKRHKNTVTLASKALAPQILGPTVRRVTVRRTDAAGNPYEQTVTLADGQTVDGDIVSESIVPAPSNTAGEMTSQQQTPVRRRPPPPKRKPKGPGRGRKKGTRLSAPEATAQPEPGAEGVSADVKPEAVDSDNVKVEEVEDNTNQDIEMADASALPSDDEEGDDADEGDEEGDGEELGDDDGDQTPGVGSSSHLDQDRDQGQDLDQDQEMGESESSEVIRPSSIEEPDDAPLQPPPDEEDITIPMSRSHPPASLSGLGPLYPPMHITSPRIEGSPLKNVMIQSPTDASPMISPRVASTTASFSAAGYMEAGAVAADPGISGPAATETFVSEAPIPIVTAASAQLSAADTEVASPSNLDMVSGAGEQALDVDGQSNTPPPTFQISGPPPEPAPAGHETDGAGVGELQQDAPQPPKSPALLPAVMTADEDDGLNLLGSLERSLDQQEGLSSAASSVAEQKTISPPPLAPATEEPSADIPAGKDGASGSAAPSPAATGSA